MQAVPDPLALLWVVDLQDGHRVDPRLLRLCRLSLRLFTGELSLGPQLGWDRRKQRPLCWAFSWLTHPLGTWGELAKCGCLR